MLVYLTLEAYFAGSASNFFLQLLQQKAISLPWYVLVISVRIGREPTGQVVFTGAAEATPEMAKARQSSFFIIKLGMFAGLSTGGSHRLEPNAKSLRDWINLATGFFAAAAKKEAVSCLFAW